MHHLLWQALLFSLHPKRWGVFFVVNGLAALGVVGIVASQPGVLVGLLALFTGQGAGIGGLVPALGLLGLLFVVWMLGTILAAGSVLFQCTGSGVGKSLRQAGRRYLTLFVVMVGYGLLANAANVFFPGTDLFTFLIRGAVTTVVVALLGLAGASLIVGGRGVRGSFMESVAFFAAKPAHIILLQGVAFLFTMAVNTAAMATAVRIVVSVFSSIIVAAPTAGAAAFAISSQLPLVAGAGLVVALGVSVSASFTHSVTGLFVQQNIYKTGGT